MMEYWMGFLTGAGLGMLIGRWNERRQARKRAHHLRVIANLEMMSADKKTVRVHPSPVTIEPGQAVHVLVEIPLRSIDPAAGQRPEVFPEYLETSDEPKPQH